MNQHKPTQRILAWMLSIVMVLGMTPPITAMAETLPVGTSGEIIAFEALAEEISNQEVALGASLGDLRLPETLTATVRLQTQPDEVPPVQDSGEPQGEEPAEPEQPATPSDAAAPGEDNSGGQKDEDITGNTGKPALTEQIISLPVAWQSEPEYDADTADTYTFTPVLPRDYTLADGVELPVITVTVGDDGGLPDTSLARGMFGAATEQFTLTPGGTYYFDLSGQDIPGTENTDLPDSSLKWVPFTYVGTVNAYSLDTNSSENIGASATAGENPSDRSLFVADYNVTHYISWNNLNDQNLIFGKAHTSGGVDYTLRSLSAGSYFTGSGETRRGTPETNEWDQILNKDSDFIKNWSGIYSWGQDTYSDGALLRAVRGSSSAFFWNYIGSSGNDVGIGFRPALEILDPDTLDSDGLKTVTYDMGGNGTLGTGSLQSATVVYTDTLTLPQITEANGFNYTGTGAGMLGWYDDSNQFYKAGTALTDLASGTTLTPGYGVVSEQFTLTPGGTYYFDLSGETIPGTKNTDLPDGSLKWVPFTYAGTVNAYSLDESSSENTGASATAGENPSDRSLFVADYNITHTVVSWDNLHTNNLIFGKNYTSGGVDYTLRSLSVGSYWNGQYNDAMRGTPETNEWDQILNKDSDSIKNWSDIFSWGQDTISDSDSASYRALRGYDSARHFIWYTSSYLDPYHGFRPALEILNPDTLGSDGLKTVTYDMGSNGTLGTGSLTSATVVYTGTLTLPQITEANGFKYTGATGAGTLGWYDGSTFYASGAPLTDLPTGTTLTPGYGLAEQFTLAPGGTYYFDLSGETIPGIKNADLPDSSLKWVPFTYAGTINAYNLEPADNGIATTETRANALLSDRSLFVADYNITHAVVSWDDLHANNLIFGKAHTSGGVDYTLRSLSVGSNSTGSGETRRGTPETNEWDQILNKNRDFIKNWSGIISWGQDTWSSNAEGRTMRGQSGARTWGSSHSNGSDVNIGFRPALEILTPDTLGSDGLKTVTYDMGSNGTLGEDSLTSATVVYTDTLALPQITEANGFTYTGTGAGDLGWYDADGKFYRAGTQLADLTTGTVLTAGYVKEQFTLTPGGTYYFDLSGQDIPGTVNTDLPDSSLKWVPFTYVGTVNAYNLETADNETATTETRANALLSDRSLFVADYNVTNTVSWDELNNSSNNLIFGKAHTSGGVAYTLRSLSVGSKPTGYVGLTRGTPETNEWDQILNKHSDFIKNWSDILSWGQDTPSGYVSHRAVRGYGSAARSWNFDSASYVGPDVGFRPALEIRNPATLGSDGLKTVTLKLNGGKLKDSTDDIHIVYTGSSVTAPDSEGLTAPTDKLFAGWKDDNSAVTYASGAAVPNTVISLSAQWAFPAEATPTATFTATGADTGTLSNVTNGMKYRIDTGSWIDITDSTAIPLTNLSACTIEVVKKGNGTTSVDSPMQEITVIKADTPALTATQPSAIGENGSIPMTTNHEYRSEADSTWTSASGNTTLAPGTYLVRIKANGTALASESRSITLTAFTGTKENTPSAVVDYIAEKLTGLTPDSRYAVNGSDIAANQAGEIAVEEGWLGTTVSLVKKGNGTTTNDSDAQSIVLAARPGAPVVAGHNESMQGKNDGKITGTTAEMEYSTDNGGTWNSCTATETTGLAPGTYLMRKKAVANTSFAGAGSTVQIAKGAAPNPGGGSSSDDRPHITVIPPAPDKPNTPTQGEIKKEGKVDGTGNGAADISEKDIKAAYEKALEAAKKNGNEKNGIAITVRINTDKKTAGSISFSLPKAAQDYIIAKEIRWITFLSENPAISMTLDLAAVKEICKQANGDVMVTAARMESSKLTKNAKVAIGSRPVFDLTVSYGKGKTVQNFGAGNVAVAIPYILAANETSGNVQAVYVDATGKVLWLISSVYDGVERVLRFSTSHFSTYGVGYKQNAPAFTDVGSHWAKDDIAFVVNRGLFSGTSAITFSPNTPMTRGMFVTALGRLANADVSGYTKSSFTDVKNDAYYMGYIEWANKNNIVNGIGDYKFAPDQSITREQMAVIMTGYAKTIGFTLPKVHVENTFADNGNISAYAKEAVKQMQMAGVISGKNGNLYDPQGTATRAEVSAVLRRFVELAISSDTAQGWTMNDSGKWMYYENGKPITGKKDIDGAAYTFDQYGVTADVPKNLRYTTYIVQKGDSFWLIAHKLGCTMSELERLNNKSRFSIIYPGDVLRVPEK